MERETAWVRSWWEVSFVTDKGGRDSCGQPLIHGTVLPCRYRDIPDVMCGAAAVPCDVPAGWVV